MPQYAVAGANEHFHGIIYQIVIDWIEQKAYFLDVADRRREDAELPLSIIHTPRSVTNYVEMALKNIGLFLNLGELCCVKQFGRLVKLALILSSLSLPQPSELLKFAVAYEEVLQVDEFTKASEGSDLEHCVN